MSKLLPILLIMTLTQSCSLLNNKNCNKFVSDPGHLRTNAEAMNPTAQFAEEKAMLIAKKEISEIIDDYIIEKYNYKNFLTDYEYETKVSEIKKMVFSEMRIICSKTVKKGDTYKSYIALEISKDYIDKEVSNKLNK